MIPESRKCITNPKNELNQQHLKKRKFFSVSEQEDIALNCYDNKELLVRYNLNMHSINDTYRILQ